MTPGNVAGDASGQSQIIWTGGSAATGTIDGGHVGASVFALGSSHLLIHDGLFGGFGPALVLADDDALMRIQGGLFFGELAADGDSVIRVVGSGFEVDGMPVGYGLFRRVGCTRPALPRAPER